LTGEVGTGKTTVVRTLLSRVPHHADVAVILNPRVTPVELLLTICEELGVSVAESDRDSAKRLVDALNQRLLRAHAEGRRIIVIVDEAQNLSAETLEQVRLLTNLETPTQKLLQIILIGQPELRALLDRNDLRQLAQRITGRYHLMPLSRDETQGYVRHRLRVAGASGEIFTLGALREVHRLSSGVPRVINVICDRALLGAYTQELRSVTSGLVREAAGEVYGRRRAQAWVGWTVGALLTAGIAAAATTGWIAWSSRIADLRKALPLHHAPDEPRPGAAPAPPPASANASATAPPSATANGPASATATAPATASIPLAALLAANGANTTDAAAFRRLLALWGTAMTEDRDPCGQAQRAGLACLEQHGSWAQVRALNRPAILSLMDDAGQKHRVVLSALDDRYATLDVGERSQHVPLEDVSRDWFGDFTVVWKPLTPRARELSMGMRGDEVRWLRRSLNALHGGASNPERGDLYDEELAIAVQNFQREHRLNVDGIAGLQTQVMLDTALADPTSPLLQHSSPHG
jgi:general secretion pathway protein A